MTLDIDPKKLLYFATVIETGSLTRAAKLLQVSQPALSTSMDRLEASIGMRLLERGPKGVVTTKHGDILYCYARLIREEIELAKRDLLEARTERAESLRIGSLPSLASRIVPLALSKWQETYKETRLQVVENAQIDLLKGLLRRDFDFVIGLTKVFDMLDGLRQRVLFRDTLTVIAGPKHPLRGTSNLTWQQLVAFPWITPTSRRTHTVLDAIMRTMEVDFPQQITVCGSLSLLKSLVAETHHLALLPAHAVQVEVAEQRLFSLPFKDPAFDRDIAVFFREGYEMDQSRRDLVACVKEIGLELCRHKVED
jgi:DNA-binding transcriptional LysR family regulator